MRTWVAAVSPSTCSVLLAWSQRQQRPRARLGCFLAALLSPRLFKLSAPSWSFLYTPVSSLVHPLHSWSAQTPRATSAAIAELGAHGEGGTPVFLPLNFLLPLLPLYSLKLNPQLIWVYHHRGRLIRGFPIFSRKHCSSSPSRVSAPLPDSFLWQHLWGTGNPFL